MKDVKTRLIIEVYAHCLFYMGQPLRYHRKLVKCTGPFLIFQTKQIKKCYKLGAPVLNLGCQAIFPCIIYVAVPVCYDQTFGEFTPWLQ